MSALKIPMYQVDAFAGNVFSGNPAAICPLEAWLPDAQMQAIAAENNLAETAFFVRNGKGYKLRWFTPVVDFSGRDRRGSAGDAAQAAAGAAGAGSAARGRHRAIQVTRA